MVTSMTDSAEAVALREVRFVLMVCRCIFLRRLLGRGRVIPMSPNDRSGLQNKRALIGTTGGAAAFRREARRSMEGEVVLTNRTNRVAHVSTYS